MAKTIKITQTRSAIGRLPKHKATLLGLGLRRIGQAHRRARGYSCYSRYDQRGFLHG
ncbi:hypothetical protein EIMP300_17870 [Escherichia coli]|uniref:50S ribosomal protein L30 n=1 Tax=Escherichia coli TaxID=562 RepID=A0A8S0FJK2_ECOLX|nr:hypothetical protein EIMP300_17870 [Escherichia coli]